MSPSRSTGAKATLVQPGRRKPPDDGNRGRSLGLKVDMRNSCITMLSNQQRSFLCRFTSTTAKNATANSNTSCCPTAIRPRLAPHVAALRSGRWCRQAPSGRRASHPDRVVSNHPNAPPQAADRSDPVLKFEDAVRIPSPPSAVHIRHRTGPHDAIFRNGTDQRRISVDHTK